MIVLDTHVLVWCSLDPGRLGLQAAAAIERAWCAAELAVSAISFWEVAMLQQRGRLQLDASVQAWRKHWLMQGLRELPLDGDVATAGAQFAGLHPDPADRWISAAAMAASATLITADIQLLGWAGPMSRQDARQ